MLLGPWRRRPLIEVNTQHLQVSAHLRLELTSDEGGDSETHVDGLKKLGIKLLLRSKECMYLERVTPGQFCSRRRKENGIEE